MWTRNSNNRLNHSHELQTLIVPDVPALARTVDATISSSTEITLNAETTFIQVYAASKDVYLKWGTADVTAANFDEVIPADQMLYFKVPNGISALNVIERDATATIVVIEK